jgi:hypothetical protein
MREGKAMPLERPAGESASSDEAAVLRALVEGTAANTGEDFFRTLVRHLAEALDVRHAFVAEFTAVRTRVRTLAYWSGGRCGTTWSRSASSRWTRSRTRTSATRSSWCWSS